MLRREMMSRLLFFSAIAAVFTALVVFKVRVAIAGGKYVVMLGAILVVAWLISRARR